MKVVIVTPYFYPHTGGVESYTLNIARNLKALGWKVVIVTTSTEHLGVVADRFEGMKIYYLKTARTVSNTPLNLQWRHELKAIFAAEKPNVINGHTPVPYLADVAERASGAIPFVLTYHNDLQKDTWPYKEVVKVLNRTMISRTLKRSTAIIATGEFYAAQSPYLKPYGAKTSIVPPGVDLALFNPQVNDDSLKGNYRGRRLLLFVGSLNKSQQHKGMDTLIAAFAKIHAKHPDTYLVAVGAGNAIPDYEAQARRAGVSDSVEFTGRIDDAQLARYYRLATVFAMPSTNNNEGFGMVFMEASASGLPVVGTSVGGIPYAVQAGKTGLLVKPNSVTDLRKALQTVLDDPQLARRLGRAGAKRAAEGFGWPLLAERTAAVLERATKPTIIQVAGYYPPHLGGMERVVQTLSEQLAARGYNVHTLTSDSEATSGTTAPVAGLSLTRFKAREFAHTPFAFGFIPAIFRTPRHQTVIHLHLAQAFYPELVLLAAKLRHIPYVVHFHLDLQPSGSLGKLFLIYKAIILRAVIRQADRVVVFSAQQRAFIHDKYGVPKHKIVIIPNGVGQDYFMAPRHYTKGPKRLLFVGRLSPQKRLHILLEALPLLSKQTSLTLVGDGEDRAQLERRAKELKVASKVRFVGAKTPAETLDYYHAADLFVLTSEREGMPLAILEAMAAGLPVVGMNVSGVKEWVSGVGVLVKEASGEAVAQALRHVTTDPERLEQLSKRSLEAAGHYSWERLLNEFEKLYERLGA